MTDLVVPEWLVLLVGRLVLENEALRQPAQPEPEQTPEPDAS